MALKLEQWEKMQKDLVQAFDNAANSGNSSTEISKALAQSAQAILAVDDKIIALTQAQKPLGGLG
jgi:hypothetical protein